MSIRDEYRARCLEDHDISVQMPILYAWAASRTIFTRPVEIIELGIRSGNSTCAFLAALQGGQGHLWSCDMYLPGTPQEWERNPQWSLIVGNDLSEGVLERMPAACDILFIDTSHEYQQTLGELQVYAPKVRPGGIILLHDTERDGVRDALRDYGADWYDHPAHHGLGIIEP